MLFGKGNTPISFRQFLTRRRFLKVGVRHSEGSRLQGSRRRAAEPSAMPVGTLWSLIANVSRSRETDW